MSMDDSIHDEETIPTRVGIIGYPVGHSLSPKMHTAAFRTLRLNWDYSLLPVPSEQVPETIQMIWREGWRGINVTVPHKQGVISLLDRVTSHAEIIGAVNTIVNENGQLVGYNTDWIGFLEALQEAGFDPTNRRAVLLGAGGAARAVLYALLEQGGTVTIANRDERKAEALALEFSAHFARDIPVLSLNDTEGLQTALNDATLLVNSTSLGMSPYPSGDPLPSEIVIPTHLTIYDLVYNPRETQLLKRARAAGATGIDGLGMLVHQGAEAFRLWTGLEAPIEVMRQAIE
jgi:shikimate dehydrogenase